VELCEAEGGSRRSVAASLGYAETPLRVREVGGPGVPRGGAGGGRGGIRFSVFTESAIDELGQSWCL
jgi:hypothetical protein